MDITGATLQRGEDRGVNEANDRAVAFGGEAVNVDGLIAALIFMHYAQCKTFAGVFEHALRLLGFLENFADLYARRNLGDDTAIQQQADFVNHHQLAGVGDRNRQTSVLQLFQRDEVVAVHQLHWHFFQQIVLQLKVTQVDELAAAAQSAGKSASE